MSAVVSLGLNENVGSGHCPDCGSASQQDLCPRCSLEFARRQRPYTDGDTRITTDELKIALPHLKRPSLLHETSTRSTFRALHLETGKSIILRVFRHNPLEAEDLFQFSERIENARCEVLTETLEIGELGRFNYEILLKPPGNTLSQLISSGQLKIDQLWRVAGMVDQYSFRLQSIGLPYPPPADCIYVAADGAISALIGPSDLIGKKSSLTQTFRVGDIVAKKYRLLSDIGEGGSSHVFEAEQLQPISRLVALKISKSGEVDSEINKQFESERCSLMRLDHPNIARILDAGFGSNGKPFLTMELIHDAIPLTEYCSTHMLSLEQKMRMFVAVCEAVAYAHSKGIIHRDLKPSNILIAQQAINSSSPPTIKIMDFGIASNTAKLNGNRSWAREMATGTPDYMAPEQNSGLGDCRADVFALGRILSELVNQGHSADLGASKLELIALKAQNTEPHCRHASPTELVACINNYLDPTSPLPAENGLDAWLMKLRSKAQKIASSLLKPADQ